MPPDPSKARDIALLDAIDALPRERIDEVVWRVARRGRDPLQGVRSPSRWCNNNFDVLYTSSAREGAIAETFALLNSQPVFPTIQSIVHAISARALKMLRLPDSETLSRLGVDMGRYSERDYRRTQAIADTAYFLGFSGLIAPSARWRGMSLVFFTDHIGPDDLQVQNTENAPVDWLEWKKLRNRR